MFVVFASFHQHKATSTTSSVTKSEAYALKLKAKSANAAVKLEAKALKRASRINFKNLASEVPSNCSNNVSSFIVNTTDICFPGTYILGRPTSTAITFSVLPLVSLDVLTITVNSSTVWYYNSSFHVPSRLVLVIEIEMSGLVENTFHTYRISYLQSDTIHQCPTHHFWTQRSHFLPFRFSIIADSHLGTPGHCDPNRYNNTLRNIHLADPDFLIALGDDLRADSIQGIPLSCVKRKC